LNTDQIKGRVDRAVAVGLTNIALMFELDTEADAATVQRLVEMTERLSIRYSEVARCLSAFRTYSSRSNS
jgi:hypothetical protein